MIWTVVAILLMVNGVFILCAVALHMHDTRAVRALYAAHRKAKL